MFEVVELRGDGCEGDGDDGAVEEGEEEAGEESGEEEVAAPWWEIKLCAQICRVVWLLLDRGGRVRLVIAAIGLVGKWRGRMRF